MVIKKNRVWVWIAIDRLKNKFIDFQIGTRGTKTGRKLWERIKNKCKVLVMTDFWKAYTNFIPWRKHVQSKAETCMIEGYNSLIRHFLSPFTRRTKEYSKSKRMIYLSLIIFMHKWNGNAQ